MNLNQLMFGLILLISFSAQVYADQTPSVAMINGIQTLVLPDSLKSLIATKYPNYRIPGQSDLQLGWEPERLDSLPFITWGDFDGNKETDVAIVLLGIDIVKINDFQYEGNLMEVIFHQQSNQFQVVYEIQRRLSQSGPKYPQQITCKLIKRGETITKGRGVTYTAVNDSILWDHSELDTSILYWDKGRYDYITLNSLNIEEL